jgi:hypothetical protein
VSGFIGRSKVAESWMSTSGVFARRSRTISLGHGGCSRAEVRDIPLLTLSILDERKRKFLQNPKIFVVQDDLWCWQILGPEFFSCRARRRGSGDTKRPFSQSANWPPLLPGWLARLGYAVLSMESSFALLGLAIALFASTNVDDVFVLVGFFADPKFRARDIVIGQYAGITALFGVSVVASLLSLVIPRAYLGLLGIAPDLDWHKEIS